MLQGWIMSSIPNSPGNTAGNTDYPAFQIRYQRPCVQLSNLFRLNLENRVINRSSLNFRKPCVYLQKSSPKFWFLHVRRTVFDSTRFFEQRNLRHGIKMRMCIGILSVFLLGCMTHAAVLKDGTMKESDQIGATPQPKFTSRGQTYRVVLGDTLVLPCEVQDLGTYVILWRRGSTVITAATLMITRDSRFRLVDGFNLEISNIMPQDAGDYVCQISDDSNRDLTHTVEVLVPPSIRKSPSSGQLTARKGGSITLECKASGNPVPSIYWSRKDNPLPSGEKAFEGFSITLDKVDRHQAGVYQCTASNGIGDPATEDMKLDVLYPPEIHVEKSSLHSGEGYKAQLVCVVHGEPQPQVTWYQDSFLLDPTDRRIMEVRGNKHLLTILNIQNSDFGNYSCQAENSLGKSRSYIELSGRPTIAKFRSPLTSRSKDSYNLTWSIDSYVRLEEVRLLYRKLTLNNSDQLSSGGQWHDIVLNPPTYTESTHTHVMSYYFRGLEPSSVYEVIVQAKNKYGWNEVSDVYKFRTHSINEEYVSEPDMRDLELTASSSSWNFSSDISELILPLLVSLLQLSRF